MQPTRPAVLGTAASWGKYRRIASIRSVLKFLACTHYLITLRSATIILITALRHHHRHPSETTRSGSITAFQRTGVYGDVGSILLPLPNCLMETVVWDSRRICLTSAPRKKLPNTAIPERYPDLLIRQRLLNLLMGLAIT